MISPYGIDTEAYPVTVRYYPFYKQQGAGSIGFYVEPFFGDSSSAIYGISHIPSAELESRPVHYGNQESGEATVIRLNFGYYSPALDVYEIGFVPVINGVATPITKDSIPKYIYIITQQAYAGGVIEVGVYDDHGEYKIICSKELDASRDWSNILEMETEDPFDLTPKLQMRIVGLNDIGEAGMVSAYTYLMNEESDATNVSYKAKFNFSQSVDIVVTAGTFGIGWDKAAYLEDVDAFYDLDVIEYWFTPTINGVSNPIDPYNPPEKIWLGADSTDCGGTAQVGAYHNGNFVVMGEVSLPTEGGTKLRSIGLTGLTGSNDGQPKKTYLRIIDRDKNYYIGGIGIFVESPNSADKVSTNYSLEVEDVCYEYPNWFAQGPFTNMVFLWTVNGIETGESRDFSLIHANQASSAPEKIDPRDPPLFIWSAVAEHSAGGKMQIGAFTDDGEFFVMGERDLPTIHSNTTSTYQIFLKPLPSDLIPSSTEFWTSFIRTREYLEDVDIA